MKKQLYFFFLIAACTLAACEPPPEGEDLDPTQLAANEFKISSEMHPDCWFNTHTLQKEVYHSRPWASKMNESWEYSYGFKSLFKDINDKMPKKIDISFWALFPKTGMDSKLVIGIDSVETNIFWVGISLTDSIKQTNEWQQIHYTLFPPVKAGLDDKLTVFVWSFDKQLLYIDDLDLKFTY
jgi:hypothetical protein